MIVFFAPKTKSTSQAQIGIKPKIFVNFKPESGLNRTRKAQADLQLWLTTPGLFLLKALPSSIKEINFYSDICSGQQRNCNFSTMCLHAIQKLSFVNINHKHFESGQSQMDVDSVHSTIERATKHSDMNMPSEWYTTVRLAKRTQLK